MLFFCLWITPPQRITAFSAASVEFERFCEAWSKYPGAVRVWKDNFRHVEQLFNYGSEVRRVMYTTSAIESVNSSFRKVTKKGSFSSETAVFKVFYLRIKELYPSLRIPPFSLMIFIFFSKSLRVIALPFKS